MHDRGDAIWCFQYRLVESFHTIHQPTRPTTQMMPTTRANRPKGHSNSWDESASNVRTSPIATRPSERITCIQFTVAIPKGQNPQKSSLGCQPVRTSRTPTRKPGNMTRICVRLQLPPPIYPEPRPNDGHSSASDLATSASDGVPWVAAAASRGVAAALADGPEVSAALWGDRPEGDGPEVSAWALAVHRRQREEP